MTTVVIRPRTAPPRTGRRTLLLVTAITLAGAVLRFALIGDKSLWLDESFSSWIANLPLDQLWRTTLQIDTHPPLYYTLLHLWIGPDSSEAALRSLSALFSTATVPVLYLVGREVGGRRLGLLVAGLQAVSPLHVWYAQQGRMYAMLTFFAAVALLCLVRLLVGGHSRRTVLLCWAGFVVATVLVMFSHNTGVLLPATVAVFVALVAAARAVVAWRQRSDADATTPLGRFGPPSDRARTCGSGWPGWSRWRCCGCPGCPGSWPRPRGWTRSSGSRRRPRSRSSTTAATCSARTPRPAPAPRCWSAPWCWSRWPGGGCGTGPSCSGCSRCWSCCRWSANCWSACAGRSSTRRR
jgi:hypothetical protein